MASSPPPRDTPPRSAPPVRLPSREKVAVGNHHVTAEGTGPEPYGPRQGLVRGQGTLQDVQARVVLAVHLPVAHEAHEVLAHPVSAPRATRWAGLGGPCWIDFDHGHACRERLVRD